MVRLLLLLSSALLCVVIFRSTAIAQEKGVAIHADPRLALLINKSKPVEHPPEPKLITPRKEISKKTDTRIPAPRMDEVRKDANEFIAEKNIPVKNPPKPAKPTPEELKVQRHANLRGSSVAAGFRGNGYRVQIYNGTSREEAMRIKAEFMRGYPGIRSYLSYVAPHYRIKVGDFRRREDAVGLFREASDTYKPCMIVPDVIGSR